MRRGGWRTGCAITVAATALLAGPAPARASVGTTRFASPHGSGTVCSEGKPCSIQTAVNNAAALDTVIVGRGTYGSKTDPITTALLNTDAISIRGASLTARPVIYTNAHSGIDLSNGGRLSNLVLHDVTTQLDPVAIFVVGNVAHVTVTIAADFGIACLDPLVLVDSVCAASGSNAWAVMLEGTTAASAPTVSGLTAEARGTGGTGLLAESMSAALNVSVFNSIVHGGGVDLEVEAFSGATAAIALTHTDYTTTDVGGDGSTAAINPFAGNIKTPPKFVNPAAGNFAEAAGSATINAGGKTPSSTSTDVLGNPRVLGSGPDMGAYEFLQKPTATAMKVTRRTTHGARVTVRVNPEGLATHVVLIARFGAHHVRSHAVAAGKGRTAHPVHLVLKGLGSGRRYRIRAVATNEAGRKSSHSKTVKTKA